MKNNIEKLLEEIENHPKKTLKDNVERRLQKSLKTYNYNLDTICDRIEKIDRKLVMKELSK